MTFDDGILTIYSVENIGDVGMMPVPGLVFKDTYYYGFDTLGVAPLAGAWIEIYKNNQNMSTFVSLPLRERGLK